MPSTPPRFATWLLKTFGHPDTSEEVQGDLLELYDHWVETVGQRKADWRYSLSALKLVRPLAKSKIEKEYPQPYLLSPSMVRSYVKIAWRNIRNAKAFALINVLGLCLGITCSLLIGLWVRDEWGIDRFHEHGKRLYRVLANTNQAGVEATNVYTPGPLAQALKKEFPRIAQASRMTAEDMVFMVSGNGKTFKEKGRYVDGDFFTMFSFPLLYGDPKSVLNAPDRLVLSASLARKYFGTENAVGKLMRLDNRIDLQVGAVMADMDSRSSFRFDIILPFTLLEQRLTWAKMWDNNAFLTYIELAPNANAEQVTVDVKQIINSHNSQAINLSHTELFLQPYPDQYLYSQLVNGKVDGGRIDFVRLFMGIGLFVLLIACINFINLATARSMTQSKEVGIRKSIGAPRKALIAQFMTEASLVVLAATSLALLVVQMILPDFNQWTQKQLTLDYSTWATWLLLGGIVLITCFGAGLYPALFLSALSPIESLNNKLRIGKRTILARRSLVVFQFAVSTVFIMGILTVLRQLAYIQAKPLGFDRHNLILIPTEGWLNNQYDAFRQDLLRHPSIQSVTWLGNNPLMIEYQTTEVDWQGKPSGANVKVSGLWIDNDFLTTMKIRLKEGRSFAPGFADSSNYIINETAARQMGLVRPMGKALTFWPGQGRIIGVVNDFHINSMHEPILPLIMALKRPWGSDVMVRTAPDQTQQAINVLDRLTKEYHRSYPFEYHFLDETFDRQYRNETLAGRLIYGLGGLAVFISCLGLFGLAAFTAEQRTKEIGVRKVLGASVSSIIALLSKDFLRLVLISIVIASPIAWYAMSRWLDNFAYRIDIEWWMFALAGLLAVGIALLTVSFQSVKAALMNPVTSLRSE